MTPQERMTPWERIMCAAARGVGLRLTCHEVARLSRDDAIATRAALDTEEREKDNDPD